MEPARLLDMAYRLDSACRSLRLIQSMAGNPDPSEACRLIIAEAQVAIDVLTKGPGEAKHVGIRKSPQVAYGDSPRSHQ